MKITCDAKKLSDACKIIRSIRPSNLPITKQALIEASEGSAFIKNTNLETTIIIDLEAEIEEDGSCLINPKRCFQLVKYESGKVNISSKDDGAVELYCGDGETRIKVKLMGTGLSKDYPFHPAKLDVLTDMINLPSGFGLKVGYALQCVTQDDNRPTLTGVFFEFQKDKLDLVSADGFRLMKVETDIATPEPYEAIVPAEPLRLVAKYMSGDIRYKYYEGSVGFQSGGLSIISQTIQGTFPQYKQLIPTQKAQWTIYCSAPVLQQRLRQMTIESPAIIRLSHQDNWLKLTSSSVEVEEVEALIPIRSEGDGHIAVSRCYLLEIASIFAEMTIEIIAPSSPIKIKGDLEGVTFVVMPMFVQW